MNLPAQPRAHRFALHDRFSYCRFDSQMDMADVKHAIWCRKEIDLAQNDLVVVASGRLKPLDQKKRYVLHLCMVKVRRFRRRRAIGDTERWVKVS